MNPKSFTGSRHPPWRRRPRLFQDFSLLAKDLNLFAEPTELFPLFGCEPFLLSLVDLELLNPATQRVVRYAKLLGYLGDASTRRGPDKADSFSLELKWVARCCSRTWCTPFVGVQVRNSGLSADPGQDQLGIPKIELGYK